MTVRETSYPGNVFPGKWLSGKRLSGNRLSGKVTFRETSVNVVPSMLLNIHNYFSQPQQLTRSSAIAKSTARPSCLLVYLMTFMGRQSTYQQLINHFYVTGHETYRIPRNNTKLWPLRCSRSFKITDFGTIYDFLLVINTNLPPILHHFQVTADYMSNFP